ncbi:MAG: 30S ribosomal protein S6 [Isosphaera sp.]|nr:30S ribosomal protein S6 [Isosphaera sp.]
MRIIPTLHYEAMILLPQSVAADMRGAVEHVKELLAKNQAEIVALKKWGDRPLAYPIRKQKRATYVLAYFAAPTSKLTDIERSFNLSESVLRVLITSAEHLTVEEMKATDGQLDLTVEANLRAQPGPVITPAQPAAAAAAAAAAVAGDEDDQEV